MSQRSPEGERDLEEHRYRSEREEAREVELARAEERRETLAKVTQIIWLLTTFLEIMIGIRVLLRLLGANPDAGFAQFIYGITAVFLAPFTALFTSPSAGASVLEISSLVAMLVYALIAWATVRIIWVALEQPPERGGPGATT